MNENLKNLIGKKIRIVHMDDQLSGKKYDGKTGVVTFVDGMGQLHGTWGCLAVIPECDFFDVLGDEDASDQTITPDGRKFIRNCLDSTYGAEIADIIFDEVVEDVQETADPANWHSGDVEIAAQRVILNKLRMGT